MTLGATGSAMKTRNAFSNMWSLQRSIGNLSGSWWWLQFGNEPFEAAVAVSTAPENYRSTPEVQNNLKLLREYLHREYATQSPINHMVLLWASTKWPGLGASGQQRSIMSDI